MSFDNLKLPESVIASLYTTPVYSLEQAPGVFHSGKSNTRKRRPVLGNNDKHTTMVVQYSNEAFLPDRHQTFIAKMLLACKMTLADVAIVNNKDNDLQYNEVLNDLSPRQLLLFGMKPAAIGLPLEFPDLTVQIYNGCSMLHAPTLDMLNQESEEATPLKKKLWTCLKQMFPLS
jgi:hypothetical protein